MGIRAKDLRECVIRPTLYKLDLYSLEAEELLLLTAAQESKLGYYLKQVGGPALGIYQIEPATHRDILRYLYHKPELRDIIDSLATSANDSELIWNLAYSTAIARVKYLMVPEAIPLTLEGQARYYKQYYNTPLGRATEDEAIKNYINYVTNGA